MFKISGKRAMRAGKWFNLFISNGDMYDIIKIIKLWEDLAVLLNGVTEKAKHEIKFKKGGFFFSFLSIFSHFFSANCNLFSSKRYKWKRN